MKNVNKVIIEIETVNEAFQYDNFSYELSRILDKIKDDINNNNKINNSYCDINGNVCCHVKIE